MTKKKQKYTSLTVALPYEDAEFLRSLVDKVDKVDKVDRTDSGEGSANGSARPGKRKNLTGIFQQVVHVLRNQKLFLGDLGDAHSGRQEMEDAVQDLDTSLERVSECSGRIRDLQQKEMMVWRFLVSYLLGVVAKKTFCIDFLGQHLENPERSLARFEEGYSQMPFEQIQIGLQSSAQDSLLHLFSLEEFSSMLSAESVGASSRVDLSLLNLGQVVALAQTALAGDPKSISDLARLRSILEAGGWLGSSSDSGSSGDSEDSVEEEEPGDREVPETEPAL